MPRPRDRRPGSPELPELPSFRFEESEPSPARSAEPAPRGSIDPYRRGADRIDRPARSPEPRVETAPIRRATTGERHGNTGLTRHDAPLDDSLIDEDAAKVVRRLEQRGFEAYLVGGCVRDLLLGARPKDFDIATSARPEDVRSLFRNCRIIGRRFRLAHVRFGSDKVIEVATFRRNPGGGLSSEDGEEDVLIRDDNAFGDAPEDARRRDFTMNALFYDLERRQVLDWCGGMADVEARAIRTIGEPAVRFREDPVRILRAVKFAARLDLGLTPEVYDALVQTRHDLERAAPPRVSEEILRLLRGGAAHRSMWLLWELGAMAVLLPDLAAFLDDDAGTTGGGTRFFRRMRHLDARKKSGDLDTASAAFDDLVLWAALLIEPIREATNGAKDPSAEIGEFLEPLVLKRFLPRRVADGLRRLLPALPRLERGDERLLRRIVASEWFGPAIDLLEIELVAKGKDPGYAARLRKWGEGQRAKLAPTESYRRDAAPAGASASVPGAYRREEPQKASRPREVVIPTSHSRPRRKR